MAKLEDLQELDNDTLRYLAANAIANMYAPVYGFKSTDKEYVAKQQAFANQCMAVLKSRGVEA